VKVARVEFPAAGCGKIIEEKASGTDRARPELAHLLGRLRRGDTLVVVRIDRLARSLSHLLAMLDRLQAAGVHFRSLSDPIDTANPTGRLVVQVIGAIAEFERNLIAERTKAGLAVAKARGRKPCVPPPPSPHPRLSTVNSAFPGRSGRTSTLIPISYCLLGYFYRFIGNFIVNWGARKSFKRREMRYCI
jgi:DNA invertase Pin-like site-specific DNA recombinase